jgi:hypothetical protein
LACGGRPSCHRRTFFLRMRSASQELSVRVAEDEKVPATIRTDYADTSHHQPAVTCVTATCDTDCWRKQAWVLKKLR